MQLKDLARFLSQNMIIYHELNFEHLSQDFQQRICSYLYETNYIQNQKFTN